MKKNNTLSEQRIINNRCLSNMKRTFILLLLFICLGIHTCFSASPTGADATYRHLKNMEYEITMVAYRDCRSIPWNIFNLSIYNDSFLIYTTPTRVKIEDIQTYCQTKPCLPPNTTTSYTGIEAHYFVDTIDFNSGVFKKFNSKNFCNVYFAIDLCCRNGILTNISSGALHVESMLNLCLAQKSTINSPQFVNPILYYVPCNQTLSYSFYSSNINSGDSVSFELVKAKNGPNSYETYNGTYSEKMPLTPYCTPPGSINCQPIISNNPVRGTTFNSKNGNYLVSPVSCTEVGVMVCQVNIFRKDSGIYKLAGYSKRDQMVVVKSTTFNKPTLTTYKDYTIKARENVCYDIKIKDDTTKTNKDTVSLIIREFPKYGTLTLLDSNAREKTMHFCWNVSDSDYIERKETNIAIYAYDKPCTLGQNMSTVINFKAIAPDSLTYITIKTFYDINKNGKKDTGEPFLSAPVFGVVKESHNNYQTDINGILTIKPFYGDYVFKINRSQFIYPTTKDTLVKSKFDSTYTITLGFNYLQGIRGKVYEDINNNCVFDVSSDIPLKGFKIIDKNKNAMALTDMNGDYLLNNAIGNYTLTVHPDNKYTSICNPLLNVSILKDSQFVHYDFPVIKKSGFKDVSILLNPQTHNRNGSEMTQTIVVENNGNIKIKNFYIKLLSSKTLFQFNSPSITYNYKDTIFWLIDSIPIGSKKTLNFKHKLMTDSFKNGDQITYQLWADTKDDVLLNNYYELTETVNDYNCCKTEKVIYTPASFFPVHPTITYRLNFTPTNNTKRALILDQLDSSRFDLRTLKILSTSNNPTPYLNQNILMVEYALNTFINNVEFIYSIDLKTPVNDSFTIYNSASCNFDYQQLKSTNTTQVNIVSPIIYDSLFKTTYCADEQAVLSFNTYYKPFQDNHFQVYLSDSTGNFTQPLLLLDTVAYSTTNSLKFKIPNVFTTNTYLLKVKGTQPALEAFTSVPFPDITIHPLPGINFTTNLNNGKICQFDSIKLKAFGANQYMFYKFGSNPGNFSKDSTYYEILKTNANYQISFKNAFGCINQSPIINSDLYFLPNVNLSPDYTIMCEGEKVTLKFSGATTYDLYRYYTTVITSGITTNNYLLIPPVGKSLYSIIGTDFNGCKDTSNQIFVQANPIPAKPVISRIGKALKSSFSLNNQWYNLSGKIDSAINQYFYPPTDGQYFVRQSDSNGCVSTSNLFDVNYTVVYHLTKPSNFTIFPNPANHEFSIENLSAISYTFNLYDAFGRIILNNSSDDKINTIEIDQLASGNYYLKINTSTETYNFRLVILN